MGKIIGEGITFDDVLLVPAYSEKYLSVPEAIYFCLLLSSESG